MKFESKFKSALLLACLGFSATNVNAQYLKASDITVGDGGTKFRVSSWTAGKDYSVDDNFYISRVKPKARFYNAKTQVNPDFKPWWLFDKNSTPTAEDYKKYSKKLLMWTPIGTKDKIGSSYTTIPNGLYNEEMFSMWQYVSTWGDWTDEFMRVPGNFIDVAHKNGVAVTTQISPAWASNLADGSNNWWEVIKDMYQNQDKTINYLDWYGLDGLGYNSEWSPNSSNYIGTRNNKKYELTVIEELNNAIAKHFDGKYKSKDLPSFSAENIWYDGISNGSGPSFDTGITDNTIAYFGDSTATANNKRTSFFYNYNWNGTKHSYTSSRIYVDESAKYAISKGRNPFDLYAGFNLQGKEPYTDDETGKTNGTWRYIQNKGVSIGLWSGHNTNVFWETRNSNGSDPETAQGNYQRVLERWFSGSNLNPSPKIKNLDVDESLSSDPNDKFFGMAKFVAAQSTLSWDLGKEPFVTYFNVGNGKFFNWKGQSKLDNKVQASREEWSNIGIQDYLPTWRWWWSDGLLNGDKDTDNNVPEGMTAEFAWNAAYFGGSSMRIKGSCDNAVLNLFKTNFEIKAGDVIKVSYFLNNGSADKIELLLGDQDGNIVEYTGKNENGEATSSNLTIETSKSVLGTWNTIRLEGVSAIKNLGVIALKFTNAQNLDINIGQLSITRPNSNEYALDTFGGGDVDQTPTESNHGIVIDKAELLGTNMYGIDGKVIFHLGENTSTLAGHYNADHKVSMFNIYAKTTYKYTEGTETKTKEVVTLMGSTTSWAGLFFKAPYDVELANKSEQVNVTLNIGVSAVALDMATESDIKWSDDIDVSKSAYTKSEDITVSSELISGGDSFTAGYADPNHDESYWVLRGPNTGTNAYNSQTYLYVGEYKTFTGTASGKDDDQTSFDVNSLPYGSYDLIAYKSKEDAEKAVAQKKSHVEGVFEYDHLLPSFIRIFNSNTGLPVIDRFVALDTDGASDAISAVTEETAKNTDFETLNKNAAGKWNYHFVWGEDKAPLDNSYKTLPGAGIKVKPEMPLTLKYEAKSNVTGEISKGVSVEDKAIGVEAKSLGLEDAQQKFTVAFWLRLKSINGDTQLLNVRNPEEDTYPRRAWGYLWTEMDQNGYLKAIKVLAEPNTNASDETKNATEVHFWYDDVKFEKNAWYHVAFVVDPANKVVKLYRNGQLIEPSSVGYKAGDNSYKFANKTNTLAFSSFIAGYSAYKGGNTIQIGGIAGKGAFAGFDGTIDNFQVYDDALDLDSKDETKGYQSILTSMKDLTTSDKQNEGAGFLESVNIAKLPNLVGFWNFEDGEKYDAGFPNEVTAHKNAKLLRFQYPVDNEDNKTQTKAIATASTTVGYPALNQGISKQDVKESYEITGSKSYTLTNEAKDGAEVGGAEGSLTVQSSGNNATAKVTARKAKLDGDKYVGYAEVTFPNYNVKRADDRGYTDITLAIYTAKLKLTNSVGSSEALYKYIYVLDYDGPIVTSVDNVKAGELSICPMKNGAIFTCAEDVKVNLFDLSGRLVKNFNLNGSEFVELAAGIYIANGKKFIVK